MSDPTTIFENTTVLQRLFAEMPSTFSRDPQSRSMLTFTLVDTSSTIFSLSSSSTFISFSILDSVLSLFSNISSIESESIDLTFHNFSTLSDYFNYKYFYTGLQCNISPEFAFTDSNLPASMLCEGSYAFIGPFTSSSSITLSRFTSNNFALFSAFSLSLIQNRKKMSSSLEQLDIRNASGKWLDYWGHLVSIDRSTDDIDNDTQYRSRIQYQPLGVRSNNFALHLAIESATGRTASVSDGGKPYVLSGSYLSSSGASLSYPGTTFPYFTSASSTWTRTLERLGPVTGSGTFIISLSLNSEETSIPQPVLSSLVPLINKWRPIGMPYVIQSL